MRLTGPRPPRQPIDWSATRAGDWWPRVALVVVALGLTELPNTWWSWGPVIAWAAACSFVPALPRKSLAPSPVPAGRDEGNVDDSVHLAADATDQEPPLSAAEFEVVWQQAKESGARI